MLVPEVTIDANGDLHYGEVDSETLHWGSDPDPVDEVALLKAQLKAQTDRCDFLEDCIAEMAMRVYN